VPKKKHYLVETIPAGPRAAREAEKARTKLLAQVDEKRNPRTRATVAQLMERYFEVLDVEMTTRYTYEAYLRNHIRPLLGELPLGRLDGEVLDSFYTQLRACRAHCRGRKFVQHRTKREHECDPRCRPHTCRGLLPSSIRQIHGILSGALNRAVRWRWLGTNPIDQAEPLAMPRPEPRSESSRTPSLPTPTNPAPDPDQRGPTRGEPAAAPARGQAQQRPPATPDQPRRRLMPAHRLAWGHENRRPRRA